MADKQGTDFNCTLDVVVGQIKFSGGTFDQTGSFEQNGGASGWGEGGCVFNAEITIKNTGATYLRMGETEGDVFNDVVHFYSTNVYALQLAYGDTTIYNNAVYLNSTGNGGISFCASLDTNYVGYALFAQEGEILTGSSGFTAGNINMKHLLYESTNSANLTGSGTSTLTLSESSFAGKVSFSSTSIYVKTTVFNDSTLLVRSGATASHSWSGGNIFKGVTTISSTFSSSSSYTFTLSLDSGDVFEKDVYFNTQILTMRVAFKGTTKFYGDVNINSSKVVFNAGRGIFMCSGEMNQSIGGSAAYLIGKLHLNKEAGKVEMMRSCTIDSSLTLSGGVFQTDSIISLKSPVTTTGSSASSFIDGPVKKTGNTAFVFPTGDQGKYRPLAISAPSQATDAFSAQYFYSPQQAGTSTDTTIGEISPCNYWDLQRKTGTSNVYVTLSWDSIGCCVLDSSNIKVINWNNSVWKDLGVGSLGGNANTGQITSAIVPYTYGLITMATGPIIFTNISPVVDRNNTDEGWYHSFVAEDPIYGYNGSNTIEPGKSWQDYANVDLLKEKNVKSLRIPSGTTANYWDWREGWFLKEHELPEGWLYEKEKYKAANISGNEMINIKPHVDELGAAPVYLFNMLTSDFHYQLASLYRAHHINLPVKYVELGNEFYLNEAHHRSKFPNASDYAVACNDWTSQLKAIAPFADVKVAVIGCDSDDDSPGRRRLWMERVLDNLDPQAQIDAITIHQYYGNGLGNLPFSGHTLTLQKMFSKPFIELETLKDEELDRIETFNAGPLSQYPLKTWITEFNLRTPEHQCIGTWAHGLFHATTALSYLESQNITSIISHTMSSDVIFGNIFDSGTGYVTFGPQYPSSTDIYEFTALGAAFNQIAKAARYATDAYKVNFSSALLSSLPLLYDADGDGVEDLEDERQLYAWLFESAAGNELIVLNLGENNFNFFVDGIFQNISTNPLNYERIHSLDETAGIIGNPKTTNSGNHYLITTNELPILTSASDHYAPVLAYSLTRISQKLPGFTLNVTDDHICYSVDEISSTSIIITGGVPPFNRVDLNPNNSTTTFTPPYTDSVIIFTPLSGLGQYTITITDANNSTASATIMVDPRPTISVTKTPLITPETCTTSYRLEAEVTSSFTSSYYNYLWTPSTGLEDFTGSPSCYPGSEPTPMSPCIIVNPDQTTSYQVYVHDGTCWSRSIEYEILRAPVNHVDIGEDLTVCYDGINAPTIKLTAILDSDPQHPFTGSFTWKSKAPGATNPTIINNCTTSECEVIMPTNNIGGTYLISAEPDPTGFPCSVSGEMEVYVTKCCDCPSNGVSLSPNTDENYIYANNLNSTILGSDIQFTNVSNFTEYNLKNVALITPAGSSATLCINGDLVIDRKVAFRNITFEMNENARIIVLDNQCLVLQGCSISSCDRAIDAAMWDGIIAERLLDKREPCVFIDKYTDPNNNNFRTLLSEAKSAIKLKNGAEYILENIDFTNNYVDIDVADYGNVIQQNTLPQTTKRLFSVHSNTFTNSVDPLLPPYDNVHKFAAIRLNEVERFVLGDSTDVDFRNTINNSIFGIRAMNSGFEVYNNEFNEIENFDGWPSNQLGGSAVFADGFNDGADRNVLIGATEAATGLKNIFTEGVNGIVIFGEANSKIFNNKFGNGTLSECITKVSTWVSGSNSKEVYITRGNEFYDYNVGVRASGISKYGHFNVGENTFLSPYINTAMPINFEGTAIWIANRLFHPSTSTEIYNSHHAVRVFENQIGDNSIDDGPRIGIYVAGTTNVAIENNTIEFDKLSPPSLYTSGIWLQMCDFAKVTGNHILNSYYADDVDLTERLTGIEVDLTNSPCISGNEITNTGHSMMFLGDCGAVKLSENIMTNYDESIHLINAEIGTQGTSTRTDDNEWEYNVSTTQPARIGGFKLNSIPITWFYDDADPKFDPDINNNIDPLLLDDKPLTNPSVPFICQPLSDPLSRNLTFGPIVGDSLRYELDYQEEFSYHAKRSLYNLILRDSSLMDLEDNADASFHDFFDVMKAGNFARLDSVRSFFEANDYYSALDLLNSISDTNTVIEQIKSVYILLCERQIGNENFSSTDSTFLIEMGEINLLLYGEAILVPRINLFREVHDTPLGSGSRIKSNVSTEEKTYPSLRIFPNPVNNELNLVINNIDKGHLEIINITGETVKEEFLSRKINVEELSPGLYFLRLTSEHTILGERFIISR